MDVSTDPQQDSVADANAESLRLAQQLEQEEFAASLQPSTFSEADLAQMDDETRQSIELAMRLQEEERLRVQEQAQAAERLQGEPEDEDSIALAIRLQQEDDEMALRNALGVQDEEDPGSPSQYSYEQLMRLQDTVGVVSRGASQDDITSLRTLTVAEARKPDSKVVLGEQCSICRMEFELDDVLRCLRCCHAEHAECLDQWLNINKSCPLCQCEVQVAPADSSAPLEGPPEIFSPVANTPVAAVQPSEPPPLVSVPLSDGTNMPAASLESSPTCFPGGIPQGLPGGIPGSA